MRISTDVCEVEPKVVISPAACQGCAAGQLIALEQDHVFLLDNLQHGLSIAELWCTIELGNLQIDWIDGR